MSFRTPMAWVRAPDGTVACDYHSFSAFNAHPSLILHGTFPGYCGALCLVGIVAPFP